MTETRHVKLDYEEALSAKKNLLSAELNLLKIVKKMKSYRILRKKELIEKEKLKDALAFTKSRIKVLYSSFPEQNIQKNDIKGQVLKGREGQETNIQKELEEIQKKLEKLNTRNG